MVTLGGGSDEVVIGAHYDAARLPDGSLSRGAVDNAASSVMLIRVAEALRGEKLPVRVRLVWFDMEELGLIGSARYVQRTPPIASRAMLNFDINAYGNTVVFGPAELKENAGLRRTFVRDVRRGGHRVRAGSRRCRPATTGPSSRPASRQFRSGSFPRWKSTSCG